MTSQQEIADYVSEVVQTVFEWTTPTEMDFELDTTIDDGTIKIKIDTEDKEKKGFLIGKEGRLINAVRTVAVYSLNRYGRERMPVEIEIVK